MLSPTVCDGSRAAIQDNSACNAVNCGSFAAPAFVRRGYVTVLVSWEGLRKKVSIQDLTKQGYVYKLTWPWILSDPVNGTGLVLAESSPGVGHRRTCTHGCRCVHAM